MTGYSVIWNISRLDLKSDTAIPAGAVKTNYDRGYQQGEKDSNEHYKKLAAELEGLSPREKRRRLRKIEDEIRSKRGTHIAEIEQTEKRLGAIRDVLVAFEDLSGWATGFLKLQKPKGSMYAAFRAAMQAEQVLNLHDCNERPAAGDFERDLLSDASAFLIEHDWWEAVHRAEDFSGGSFRLPYDVCVFEFAVSERRVLAIAINYSETIGATQPTNEVLMQVAVNSLVGWTLSTRIYRNDGGEWEPLPSRYSDESYDRLVRLLGNQIKAACVALDAEVATSTVVRQANAGKPHEDSDLPLIEYRTLSLARKARVSELSASVGDKRERRLHFRRGHWRHYETFKTWVRWCLVGNPDLGFIDKQYRL